MDMKTLTEHNAERQAEHEKVRALLVGNTRTGLAGLVEWLEK